MYYCIVLYCIVLCYSFILQEILNQMNNSGVPMNLLTLNSILHVLSTMRTSPETKKYALKTIAEAKKFNIEPCLASYYYLLQIFCSDSMLMILEFCVICVILILFIVNIFL